MRIIHFSDSHVGGPAENLSAYFDKRWVGVFNYRFRRKFQHDQNLLARAVDFILRRPPDLVVCTGDITSTGQPSEFRAALAVLEPLLQTPAIPLLYIPGNHDYYVHQPDCVAAMKDAVRLLNRNRFDFDDLPLRIPFAEIDVLMVNESRPSNLLASWGFLSKETNRQVATWCAEPKSRPRMLIGHYPLIEPHPMLRLRHRLFGQHDVLALLNRGDLDLSLCGHQHQPHAHVDGRGRGEICAGSITRNACLAEIEYDSGKDIFHHRKLVFHGDGDPVPQS
jgi:predicted MPP superfamily phosphohydrolase